MVYRYEEERGGEERRDGKIKLVPVCWA